MRSYCLVAILAALSASALAADKPPALTDTATFRAAFRASFYGFDICGDAGNGRLYRKALTEKVDHCPFTGDAKASFHAWAAGAEPRGAADVQLYIAEHDKLPERLDRMKLNCRTEQTSPAYQETMKLLGDYARGDARFDAVVPDPCDAKAAKP
jgi:hypothetical protein